LALTFEDMQWETQTMQQLNHKNVIRYWATSMYEWSDQDGDLVREYCMELAPGGTLAQLIERGTPLLEERVRKLVEQMASVVDICRRSGVNCQIAVSWDVRVQSLFLASASLFLATQK
jgi:serine/threonine protein kinase